MCILGIFAMLSKAIAVSLPLSLFAVDIWMGRSIKIKKVWLEKIPLVLIAVVVGLVAIKGQEAGKFLGLHPEYGPFETIVFAAYAYTQYIFHFFSPSRVSVLYPYPNEIGLIQYVYSLIALGVIALAIISYKRRWFVLSGGIVFYTVNIMFLLQFVQFGEVLMADRYLYIPCIGLIVPLVYYVFTLLQKRAKQTYAAIVCGIISGLFLIMTFARNNIWLSDFNFFDAIVKAFPNSAVAQYSVGSLYMRQGNYPEAEAHINLAVLLEPGNYKAWYDKGVLYLRERKPAESLEALNKCLALKDYTKAYFSRALLYQSTGECTLALADVDKVLAGQPQNSRAYYIKGDCMEQQEKIKDAIDYYSKAIQFESNEPLFYIRRGLSYAKANQNNAAMNDLNTAVDLNPQNGEAWYFRGLIKYRNGGNPCDDMQNALAHGYQRAQEILGKACNH